MNGMEKTLSLALSQKPTKIQAGDLLVIDVRNGTFKFVRDGAILNILSMPGGRTETKLHVSTPGDSGLHFIIMEIASILTGFTVRRVDNGPNRFTCTFEEPPKRH